MQNFKPTIHLDAFISHFKFCAFIILLSIYHHVDLLILKGQNYERNIKIPLDEFVIKSIIN